MPKKCVVPNCFATRGHVPPFHVFPKPNKDPDRFNDWLKAIGGDILKMDPDKVCRSEKICNIHFEEMFYVRNHRLSNIAVPTLHMPERVDNGDIEPDNGTQEEGIETVVNSDIESDGETLEEGVVWETQVIDTQSCSATKDHDYSAQCHDNNMENVTVYVPEYVCPANPDVVASEEIVEGDCEDVKDDMALEPLGDDDEVRYVEESDQLDDLLSTKSEQSRDCEEVTDDLALEHHVDDRVQESDQSDDHQSSEDAESQDCGEVTDDLALEHHVDDRVQESDQSDDHQSSEDAESQAGNTDDEDYKEELQSSVFKVICDGQWKKENNVPNSGRSPRIASGTTDVSKDRSQKGSIQKLSTTEFKLYLRLLRDIYKMNRITQISKKRTLGSKFAVEITRNPQYLIILETSESRYRLKRMISSKHQQSIDSEKTRIHYSLQQKIMALTIFKHAPGAYSFLKEIFYLPSLKVVKNLISRNDTTPGLNPKMFKHLKNLLRNINVRERLCVLIYDEICLKVEMKLNVDVLNRDAVFPEYVRERKSDNIDYGQVFIIRGILKNYVQPVSYSFTEQPLTAKELAQKIKDVVAELQKAGAIVICMVVDRNDVKLQALDILKHETRCWYIMNGKEPIKHVICVNGKEIVLLHDPPSLLKCIRNELLTKNLQFTDNEGVTKVGKWQHIAMLYNERPGFQGVSCLPYLTENHVVAEKIPLGNTEYVCQVFSRTVGVYMGYMAETGILPQECTGTANALLFFNKLFDSQNGTSRKKFAAEDNTLLRPVSPVSRHHHVWKEAIKLLETMQFVDPTTGANIKVNALRDWATSLENLEFLLKRLVEKYQITSIWVGQLNQDPLEDFFSLIRDEKCTNDNPLDDKFDDSTSLVVNRVAKVYKVRTKEL